MYVVCNMKCHLSYDFCYMMSWSNEYMVQQGWDSNGGTIKALLVLQLSKFDITIPINPFAFIMEGTDINLFTWEVRISLTSPLIARITKDFTWSQIQCGK